MSWLHRIFTNPATVFHTECDVLALIKVLITAFKSSINEAMVWRVVGEMMLSSRWGEPSSVSTSKSSTSVSTSPPWMNRFHMEPLHSHWVPRQLGTVAVWKLAGPLGEGERGPGLAWLPAVKILISKAVSKFYLFLFLLFCLLLALLVTDCTCQCFPASCSLYTAL